MSEKSTEPGLFAAAIEEALDLLKAYSGTPGNALVTSEPLPSLLEQCEAICETSAARELEPVRTIHHFACTGGTLLSKCIAVLPNTVLLSEVDPLSLIQLQLNPKKIIFSATDLILDLRYSLRGDDEESIKAIFLAGLGALRTSLSIKAQHLVLRDHTHSHFCTETDPVSRETMHDIIADAFPVRSLVTVRHPLDSFLALDSNGWRHFQPFNLEEYCRRYQAFLAAYEDVRRLRYEDFVADPEGRLREICETLDLPFDPGAIDFISVVALSGDSGRSGTRIAPRPRRQIPEAIGEQARGSKAYAELCEILEYDPVTG